MATASSCKSKVFDIGSSGQGTFSNTLLAQWHRRRNIPMASFLPPRVQRRVWHQGVSLSLLFDVLQLACVDDRSVKDEVWGSRKIFHSRPLIASLLLVSSALVFHACEARSSISVSSRELVSGCISWAYQATIWYCYTYLV